MTCPHCALAAKRVASGACRHCGGPVPCPSPFGDASVGVRREVFVCASCGDGRANGRMAHPYGNFDSHETKAIMRMKQHGRTFYHHFDDAARASGILKYRQFLHKCARVARKERNQ